jgi:hypothetical protein
MELLINASNHWSGDENAPGNGSSWQMVLSETHVFSPTVLNEFKFRV